MVFNSILFIFISLFFTLVFILCIFLLKYKKIKNDITKIYLAINRIRYGNIHIRVNNLSNKTLENAVNRLFETISDREIMIREYQNTLSKENLSLEAIIKNEKEMLKVKEDFTATLTHDMKVPVIAELNSIEYLLSGRFGALNEKQIEVLRLMKSSENELKELIENMLEIYKLENKNIKLNCQYFNLNNFLKDAISQMQPIISEKNIEISFINSSDCDIELNFDLFQLKRVIKNLLQNAASYSQNGSEITIKTEISDVCAKIFVINKGIGISQNDLELIFQKYYTGNSKYRKSGAGLGLYISRIIMLAHNGNLEVDNSKEGYTTFIVTLNR